MIALLLAPLLRWIDALPGWAWIAIGTAAALVALYAHAENAGRKAERLKHARRQAERQAAQEHLRRAMEADYADDWNARPGGADDLAGVLRDGSF